MGMDYIFGLIPKPDDDVRQLLVVIPPGAPVSQSHAEQRTPLTGAAQSNVRPAGCVQVSSMVEKIQVVSEQALLSVRVRVHHAFLRL